MRNFLYGRSKDLIIYIIILKQQVNNNWILNHIGYMLCNNQ